MSHFCCVECKMHSRHPKRPKKTSNGTMLYIMLVLMCISIFTLIFHGVMVYQYYIRRNSIPPTQPALRAKLSNAFLGRTISFLVDSKYTILFIVVFSRCMIIFIKNIMISWCTSSAIDAIWILNNCRYESFLLRRMQNAQQTP